MPKPTKKIEHIAIPRPDIREIVLDIEGQAPLMIRRFGEKAKDQIQANQNGQPKTRKKSPRNPEAEYLDSVHRDKKGNILFPAGAFRLAAVAACRQIDGISMVLARGLFNCPDEFVKIEGAPVMDTRAVKIGPGITDIRYRARIDSWRTKLRVRYNAGATSAEQIINLLALAGETIGVGEYRLERGGNYGRFTLA